MSRAVPNKWKKFNINFKPLSEMTWEEILCLENIWKMNRCTESTDVMVL